MRYNEELNQKQLADLVSIETKRLCEKYNKDFLDCEDLIKITNLGRDNVRAMMHRRDFPLLKIGRRNVVNISSFAYWCIKQTYKEM